MLNPEDRQAIEGLFDRLAEVERRNPDRDRDAEELIKREIERQPGAPYYMAQTIIVEQRALALAEQRINELEAQLAERSRAQQPAERQRGPWDRGPDRPEPAYRGQGGGFLAGAAQTALGVAGGVLLGSAIGSLLGAGGANAAESAGQGQANDDPQPVDQSTDQDQQQDDPFGDGGDFGDDGGGFDMGGDF